MDNIEIKEAILDFTRTLKHFLLATDALCDELKNFIDKIGDGNNG